MKYFLHAALVLCLAAAGTGAGAAVISIDPATQDVDLGLQASVDVVLDQAGGALVGAYDIDIGFSSGVLALAEVVFGAGLGGPLDTVQLVTPEADRVNAFEVSLLVDLSSLQTGTDPFTLFTLVFDTLAAGVADVEVLAAFVSDDLGNPLAATVQSGGVNVLPGAPAPVPEPDGLLLGIGLVALIAARLRRGVRS